MYVLDVAGCVGWYASCLRSKQGSKPKALLAAHYTRQSGREEQGAAGRSRQVQGASREEQRGQQGSYLCLCTLLLLECQHQPAVDGDE
jgi:hypothetical protein